MTCMPYLQALKAEGVEFIVAPYEADAQMTYLAISGRVHAVFTEDSDMLPYGCPKVNLVVRVRRVALSASPCLCLAKQPSYELACSLNFLILCPRRVFKMTRDQRTGHRSRILLLC